MNRSRVGDATGSPPPLQAVFFVPLQRDPSSASAHRVMLPGVGISLV